ncbi:hypothetical protein ABE41_000015 [Fictibacillus arsenicus]|uniref:Uncharacterized protein n=1 Tax=Fictibacillus arsenicus TaxID=255247 RepID=A0A1B1YZ16_9BACL|nr:hypothetical protein ABE41_000015 [Fictibacillus arsenicus]
MRKMDEDPSSFFVLKRKNQRDFEAMKGALDEGCSSSIIYMKNSIYEPSPGFMILQNFLWSLS